MKRNKIKYIDLFCGIGGFRLAIESAAKKLLFNAECVLSSDIDKDCQKVYEANFGELPVGDIKTIDTEEISDFELLLAGFPCQPFSICGNMEGFNDTRGTLFFEIARILEAKQPDAFLLENVKLLVGHNQGKTLSRILSTLSKLGYNVDYRVYNALDFGLPQKRERVTIVGFKNSNDFIWPIGDFPMKSLDEILEKKVDIKYFASQKIQKNRKRVIDKLPKKTTIWHENKAGHISAYPYSCALRAGASYNYLLVNGERRLTPRELLRLQGFPDSFKIVCNDSQTRKQAGNAVPVPLIEAVLENMMKAYLAQNKTKKVIPSRKVKSQKHSNLFASA